MDDIIFDGSSLMLLLGFQEMMEKEFQMSMMRELTFFLGIQVMQTKQGTFIHQARYTKDLMKKLNMVELKPVSTPMSTATVLDLDKNSEVVDQGEYKSMIGSLLYSPRPGWTFSSSCSCVHAFRLPYALHIGQLFSESSGISNTHSNLGFGIQLLLRSILLSFPMMILQVVELVERALLLLVIFLYLLLFVGQLANSLLSNNPPQNQSM
jgi:hypothetical protein